MVSLIMKSRVYDEDPAIDGDLAWTWFGKRSQQPHLIPSVAPAACRLHDLQSGLGRGSMLGKQNDARNQKAPQKWSGPWKNMGSGFALCLCQLAIKNSSSTAFATNTSIRDDSYVP